MSWEKRMDEARIEAPEVPSHRARKDKRRWCRGKVGVEHTPAIRFSQHRDWWANHPKNPREVSCAWWPWGVYAYKRWSCYHEEACTSCGKILRHSLERDCPDFPNT